MTVKVESRPRLEDKIKSDAWQNLYFDVNGHSYRGIGIFLTEEHAKVEALDSIHNPKWYDIPTLEGNILRKSLSHAIQIPVKP